MEPKDRAPRRDRRPRKDRPPRRCRWALSAPEYVAYHDTEWGRPVLTDDGLYERLCLEGFQAGLSWLTVLRRREAFRAAFADFHIRSVAKFGPGDVARLLEDARLIRHRGKIEAAIENAWRALEAIDEVGSLARLVWWYRPSPRRAPRTTGSIPARTAESTALSRELRRRGFRFVGPTTIYGRDAGVRPRERPRRRLLGPAGCRGRTARRRTAHESLS